MDEATKIISGASARDASGSTSHSGSAGSGASARTSGSGSTGARRADEASTAGGHLAWQDVYVLEAWLPAARTWRARTTRKPPQAQKKSRPQALTAAQIRRRSALRAKRAVEADRLKFSRSWLKMQAEAFEGEVDDWEASQYRSDEQPFMHICRDLNRG